MKFPLFVLSLSLVVPIVSYGQLHREDIYTDFVFYNKRARLEKDLRENIISATFQQPLDSNNEYKFESACNAVTQFMFSNQDVKSGIDKLFSQYSSLQPETKRALLEAAYGVFPLSYTKDMETTMEKETNPKLFAMSALYLFRNNHSVDQSNTIKIRMVEQFPGYDTINVLLELEKFLNTHYHYTDKQTPDIAELFVYQRTLRKKIIYSFQRWNRDYPGLAIIQYADGSFAREANGRLQVFRQLARSASDLPYFITNGNTPQGIYSIKGIAVANNHFIGPTPNFQLIMPFEDYWIKYFQRAVDSSGDVIELYRQMLPPSWRQYEPMNECYFAGNIGRTEIIAHGTTIDPEYFKDKPFYPLTPTLGCLCAKEIWNVTSGRLLVSEQFNLVRAFQSTPGDKGYLFVINIDDQQKPIGWDEVEHWVKKSEKRK